MTERVLSGRYALREIIGMGGMSIVYKAWDSQLRREVAVKVLRPEFSNDEEFVRRFTNEAHAVLQMHHANIVDIFGLGQDGDTRYIVMEFVNGVTLKEMIRQEGPIKPRRAVQMAIRILAAVDHAHKNHIVHRDIKPQNIMVNADYHVKVTDFGIARATNADQTPVDVPEAEQKSEPKKNVLGSVHYFSPEQASGQVADEKSDLYSVGVVLYEMLTGRVPFDGESAEDVAIKHVREMPAAPSSIRSEISVALDQVIERALAKDSAQRYQTAADMAADLKRALRMPEGGFIAKDAPAEAPQAEPEPVKARFPWKKLLRAVALLGLLALAVCAFFLGRGFMRSMQTSIETPAVIQMHIEDAAALLESEGVPYTIEETPEGDTPIGTVIGQYPLPGDRLSRDSRLTLYVSTGAHSSYVPTLVGMDVREAQEKLTEYGLKEGSVEYVLSLEEAGTVISQDPESGAYVSDESEVHMVVSGQSASMPDCTGRTLEDARILLDLDGFELGEVTDVIDTLAPDTVISQSVSPGKQTLAGEKVDLVVCRLDPETARRCNVRLRFSVPTELSEVRMTLEDEDGLRTVYREELSFGEHTVDLTLLSRDPGAHSLSVYIGGELIMQKQMEFR